LPATIEAATSPAPIAAARCWRIPHEHVLRRHRVGEATQPAAGGEPQHRDARVEAGAQHGGTDVDVPKRRDVGDVEQTAGGDLLASLDRDDARPALRQAAARRRGVERLSRRVGGDEAARSVGAALGERVHLVGQTDAD
jgi:hypothetical protein